MFYKKHVLIFPHHTFVLSGLTGTTVEMPASWWCADATGPGPTSRPLCKVSLQSTLSLSLADPNDVCTCSCHTQSMCFLFKQTTIPPKTTTGRSRRQHCRRHYPLFLCCTDLDVLPVSHLFAAYRLLQHWGVSCWSDPERFSSALQGYIITDWCAHLIKEYGN